MHPEMYLSLHRAQERDLLTAPRRARTATDADAVVARSSLRLPLAAVAASGMADALRRAISSLSTSDGPADCCSAA